MHRRAQRCHLADQTLLSQRSGVPGGRFILTQANTYHAEGITGRGEERVDTRGWRRSLRYAIGTPRRSLTSAFTFLG